MSADHGSGEAAQAPAFPSGRQFEIRSGDQVAALTEVGGALRDYRLGTRPLVDGYSEDDMATGARGQCLIPWPNRVGGGRYEWDGRNLQLDLSEPDKGGAIQA